jgi:hypothetical protein
MSKDEIVFAALVLVFASFVTSHVALCLALASRPPRTRGLIALFAVPMAPVWGARAGLRKRVALWVAFAVAYVVLRLMTVR